MKIIIYLLKKILSTELNVFSQVKMGEIQPNLMIVAPRFLFVLSEIRLLVDVST